MFRLRMQEFASFKIISSGLRVRSIALTPYPHLKIAKFARTPNDQGFGFAISHFLLMLKENGTALRHPYTRVQS